MSRTKLVLWAGTSGMALLLAGCEGGSLIKKPDGEASSSAERPAASQLVDQDIEAPEIFQKVEAGLWDGRPSLGGVWVAHPDVKTPERVVIRNEATGKQVIGALFRRERENPGPRLQVSSDAAAALGLVAGAPTQLDVTALRREAPKKENPVVEAAEPLRIADEPAAEQPDVAQTIKPVAKPKAADLATGAASAVAPATGAVAEASEAALGPPLVEEAPKEKKGFLSLFKRKPKPAEPIETSAAILEAPEAVATATLAPASEGDEIATAAVAAIAATSVDTAAPADAALDSQGEVDLVDGPLNMALSDEVMPKQKRWTLFQRKPKAPASALRTGVLSETAALGEIVPDVDVPQMSAAELADPGAEDTHNFVQIGIFSLKEQAEQAATEMRNNGVVPTLTQSEQQGTTYWSVLAGPAPNPVDRLALLRKVKGLGYSDAFTLRQ